MDLNKVFSKSLQKMLSRKLLFNCQMKKLQTKQKHHNHHFDPQKLFQNNIYNPQSNLLVSQKSIKSKQKNRQLSPYQSRIQQIIAHNRKHKNCLQNQVDQILKVMTQQCQSILSKKAFNKRLKYQNYRIERIATQENISSKNKSLDKKKRVQSTIKLPKLTVLKLNSQQMQDLQIQNQSSKIRNYVHDQKRHQSQRIKTQNQIQSVRDVTKHYRAGAISTKDLHSNMKFL